LERLLDEYRSLEPTTDQEEKKRLTEQVAELNRKIESLQQQQQETASSSDGDFISMPIRWTLPASVHWSNYIKLV